MKISENTSVSMPIKNMLAIVAGVIPDAPGVPFTGPIS